MTLEEFEQEKGTINKVHKISLTSCNILKATVGSTGLKGGDWGHGSRAVIKFSNSGSPIYIKIDDKIFETEKIELLIGGDTELETFKEAFDFISEHMNIEGGK